MPLPKTPEEIAWFVNYMKTALSEVLTMAQLADLWTANVATIRTLEKKCVDEIVAAKDVVKAKLQAK